MKTNWFVVYYGLNSKFLSSKFILNVTEAEADDIAEESMPLECEFRRIVEITEVYPAKNNPNVSFFAEKDETTNMWMIVAQAVGFPASECHDDWFSCRGFAENFAKEMAENYTE